MHDSASLESLGIPTVFVASDQFTDAAIAQSRSLGTDPARVFVPHPIQDRTDAEIRDLADAAFHKIISRLVNESDQQSAG